MPTGYTAPIKDGISFNDFMWGCARAFGALIMMRDDPPGTPIPERFEPYCCCVNGWPQSTVGCPVHGVVY